MITVTGQSRKESWRLLRNIIKNIIWGIRRIMRQITINIRKPIQIRGNHIQENMMFNQITTKPSTKSYCIQEMINIILSKLKKT